MTIGAIGALSHRRLDSYWTSLNATHSDTDAIIKIAVTLAPVGQQSICSDEINSPLQKEL